MPLNVYGFVFGRLLAQREGIQDPQAQNRMGVVQGFLGTSPINLIVVDQLARNEAAAQAATATVTPAAPVPSTSTPTTSGRMVQVPGVTGIAFDSAQKLLQSYGLQAQRQDVISSTTAKGVVINQNPLAGATVPAGTTVALGVSLGVVVPDVTNQAIGDATAQLQAIGLQVQPVDQRSSTVQKGLVIGQNPPPGSTVSSGSTVTLTVSLGDKVTVPKVIEESVEAASKELQDLGLQVKLAYQSSGGINKGFVINQDPPAGTPVSLGSQVTLTVSTGQDFQMPDVVGQLFSDAQKLLQSKNLQVQRVDQTSDAVRQDFVISQDPAAGTLVSPNSTVTLSVSLGIPQADLPNLIGQSFSEARETLQDLDFIVKRVDVDSEQSQGTVVNQEPKAGKVAPESQVTLYVSRGPAHW
jgi:beta-lactam-binding protein with PASTA domain